MGSRLTIFWGILQCVASLTVPNAFEVCVRLQIRFAKTVKTHRKPHYSVIHFQI